MRGDVVGQDPPVSLVSVEDQRRAKGLLTPRQFECWRYHYVQNCSYAQIAWMLGLAKGTVRDRVKRADQLLVRPIGENTGHADPSEVHPAGPEAGAGKSAEGGTRRASGRAVAEAA